MGIEANKPMLIIAIPLPTMGAPLLPVCVPVPQQPFSVVSSHIKPQSYYASPSFFAQPPYYTDMEIMSTNFSFSIIEFLGIIQMPEVPIGGCEYVCEGHHYSASG